MSSNLKQIAMSSSLGCRKLYFSSVGHRKPIKVGKHWFKLQSWPMSRFPQIFGKSFLKNWLWKVLRPEFGFNRRDRRHQLIFDLLVSLPTIAIHLWFAESDDNYKQPVIS